MAENEAMRFSFLAREAGRVHVCGHRGYSLCYPENTMPAFEAAKACGATTVEADIVLTADAEPIVLHDRTLDRTTDGHGFAADFSLEQIRSLDAGTGLDSRFAGTGIPTLAEVLDWAKREEMGLFLEIKEAERPDLAIDRIAELVEATGTADRVTVISFDHVLLKHAAQRHRGVATQAITHARHADIVGVLRACGARSVSIELDMFHPADAQALHDAGFSVRLSLPGPDVFAAFRRGRRDIVPAIVRWIADGLIDTISGDDVPFLAGLVGRAGRAG
jgi:glycerophosphoryl diester phosphodiesterase